MTIATEVRLLSLPTRQLLRAGHDPDPALNRELVVIRMENADGVVGWGECSALNRPTYTAEWAAGAFGVYQRMLRDGTAAQPGEATTGTELDNHPMARAGWEMAVMDLGLRARGESLAHRLGAARRYVPAGVAIGLGSDAEIEHQVADATADGFTRIKLKIEPGPSLARAIRIRAAHPTVELHLDGNGSFGAGNLPALVTAVDAGCTILEQPFAPDDVSSAASLVRAGALVVADEAVNSMEDAQRLFAAGALSGIAIKPPRVGGIGPTLELLDWCRRQGVAATAGGMLECGLGRHALAAVAGLDGFTLTGDLSPARRWLADDPWPDVRTVLVRGALMIEVPTGPGVAPEPDPEVLDRYTVERVRYLST